MKKRILILALLLIGSFNSFSQKLELGKVSDEELQEKAHPKDTSAIAAILFQKGDVRFDYSQEKGFDMKTIIRTRIKIYKKDGYEYANYIQKYYTGSNAKETVSFSDAYTYNLVNGKVEKTKLKSDGIFDEKINKFWSRKKITMPNVQEGSIIEFECRINSDRIGTIDEWEFQKDIPVNFSELVTNIPEYFVYNSNQKGSIFPKNKVEKNNRKINYTYTINASSGLGGSSRAERSNEELNFIETQTTFTAENLPAMKDEAYVNNIKNYTSSISHELTRVQYPNQPFKSFSTNWDQVTKTIYESDEFGGELNKTGYFENDVNTLISGLNSREEKIAALFNFVKSKVKWNNYLGYSVNDGVRQAYKNGTGNVAEINLMLTAMLRYANVDANPVLVSTRSNGITYFPNLTAFNYVISAVEIDNGLILLDATDQYSLPNVLPIRDLNWFGRLIRKEGTSAQVNLTPDLISKDITSVMATIATDGSVDGKVREQHFDYNAFVFRDKYADLSQDSYLEKLEKNHAGIEVSDYNITGKMELGQPIVENYSFKHNNSVEIIGDKIYFSPLLFLAQTENPFKQETREYPVDFVYPNQDKYLINITIPDGYVVETLPASVSIPMSDNLMGLKYIISNSGNKIQLSLTFDVNTAILSADYYPELKAVYAEIVKKETEKIVLKKA